MSEQARRLIAENQRTQNPYLDLGYCGLTDLTTLPELFDCVHLEMLILSNKWYEYENGKWQKSQNEGEANVLMKLSPDFYKLKNLKTLVCGGYWSGRWGITDIVLLPKNWTAK
jgi:hypothetical protein